MAGWLIDVAAVVAAAAAVAAAVVDACCAAAVVLAAQINLRKPARSAQGVLCFFGGVALNRCYRNYVVT